ncbi:MAG: group II intron reverse transcriptase/maturase [Flavobacteriales bacterium]|nr:group II intron reverse transcriptase/maturase [Flavobacteriales bacterium]
MSRTKPFSISKQLVWRAYKRVKSNKGGAGVDEQSITDFEVNLKDNLYKLWNRMSSGSYFPLAVLTVEIPKGKGSTRRLGIPTVGDRIAQMVVKLTLEPKLEPCFHPDSYGYRPQKSAIEAVGVTRQRCWQYDWVIDLDIKGFFDNLDHSLLMQTVKKHTNCKWTILYIQRWLKVPSQDKTGQQTARERGTPQGGVISPLLANLYLHYAFDEWMKREYPNTPFERYADDSVIHCQTEVEAQQLLKDIADQLMKFRLELHPEKTRVVYCKDKKRNGDYPNTKFDFLGYTFRSRRSMNRWGKHFINFSPAVSEKAKKEMRQKMRSWRLHLRSDKSLEDISHMFNPVLRGWINYYGRYYKTGLYPVFRHLNRTLARWATRKYKKLRGHRRRAEHWLGRVANNDSHLFAHWERGFKPSGSTIGAV